MKKTIHDGSVSYSVSLPNPKAGLGRHAKTEAQKQRRHAINVWLRLFRVTNKEDVK